MCCTSGSARAGGRACSLGRTHGHGKRPGARASPSRSRFGCTARRPPGGNSASSNAASASLEARARRSQTCHLLKTHRATPWKRGHHLHVAPPCAQDAATNTDAQTCGPAWQNARRRIAARSSASTPLLQSSSPTQHMRAASIAAKYRMPTGARQSGTQQRASFASQASEPCTDARHHRGVHDDITDADPLRVRVARETSVFLPRLTAAESADSVH